MSKSGILAQGVRVRVLMGDSSLWVCHISAHFAFRALNYLLKDDCIVNNLADRDYVSFWRNGSHAIAHYKRFRFPKLRLPII